jgi:serralysin
MPSENVGMTGDQNINAILSGVKWSGTVVTYGWPLAASEYGTGDDYDQTYDHDNNPATPDVTVNESDGFFALNPMQQAAVEAAFLEFRRVTNMSALRQEPAAGADIRVAMSTTMEPGATTAYAAYPSDTQFGGDSWFTTANYNTPRLGTFAYQTFFHEMGHALGLKHGHETDNGNMNVMTAARNSLEFSTMTYADYIGQPTGAGSSVTSGHSPQTFMMYDIAALQHMYGADFTDGAHSGATVYWFDPNNGQTVVNGVGQGIPQNDAGTNVNVIFRTIWDGGGSDTYDFSAYGADRQLDVDLAPGSWTDVDSDSNFQAADLDRTDPERRSPAARYSTRCFTTATPAVSSRTP